MYVKSNVEIFLGTQWSNDGFAIHSLFSIQFRLLYTFPFVFAYYFNQCIFDEMGQQFFFIYKIFLLLFFSIFQTLSLVSGKSLNIECLMPGYFCLSFYFLCNVRFIFLSFFSYINDQYFSRTK